MTTRTPGAASVADPAVGLTVEEAARRQRDGLGNQITEHDPRPLRAIFIANVATRFNLLLGVLGVAIVLTGALRDALFVVVAVINTIIGVAQELRARHTLRRLELIDAPLVTVIRSGQPSDIDAAELVLGDVVIVGRGDQIPVDGVILVGTGLEIDESMLTGESDPVAKQPGDAVYSGSAVVAGSARFVVNAVGDAGMANTLIARAREFQPVRSEIRQGIERMLRVVTWLLVPTARC